MREFFVKFFDSLVNRAIITLALIIAGFFILIGDAKASDLDQLQKQVLNPVVQLHRNCSGVVIDTPYTARTYIVTANHCVSDDATPDPKELRGVVTIDKKDKARLIATEQYVYDVIVRDKAADLAVLKLRQLGLLLEGATIGQSDPVEGEPVWTVGYPLGLTRTITAGFFGGFESLDSDLKADRYGDARAMYRATPPIFGGNSGGGMFHKDGDKYVLVGISDVVFPSFFVAGYYVPQEAINDIVDRALKNDEKPKSEKKEVGNTPPTTSKRVNE